MEETSTPLPARQIASCGDVSCELLVDNRKPNSLAILRMTQQVLRNRGVDVDEQIRRKPSAGRPMEEGMLADLTATGGLILADVSD